MFTREIELILERTCPPECET